nr:hypothetical protein [Borreliella bissettiae]
MPSRDRCQAEIQEKSKNLIAQNIVENLRLEANRKGIQELEEIEKEIQKVK